MLHTYVDSLANNAVADDFVDSDANCPDTHVEHTASLPVIVFVWHAHSLSGVSLDIHIVTTVERRKVTRNRNSAVPSERLREQIPGFAT